jgi:calcium/calmodulin-dependent 3',5'-cyclic nucleotide phosphodiesterase
MHFHNLPHAVTVLHSTFLLRATVSLPFDSALDEVALLFAALCHDLDHRALSNSFYTNSKSDFAKKYGTTSVLEHHHAETAFSLLFNEEIGVMGQLSTEEQDRFRDVVFKCILSTDMAVHKDRLDFLVGDAICQSLVLLTATYERRRI